MHKSTRDILSGMVAALMLVIPFCFLVSLFWGVALYGAAWLFCLLLLILRAVERLSPDVQELRLPGDAAAPEDPAAADPRRSS